MHHSETRNGTNRIYWTLAFLTLLAIVLWRGVFPALVQVSSDFPNYYAGARLLITGQAKNGIYDNAWFGRMAADMGLSHDSRFIPFPPPTMFLLAPVAWLSPLNALRVWTFVNVILAAYSIRLLAILTNRDWRWCGTIVLLSGHAIINNFKFGQAYVALMAAMIMLLFDLRRKKEIRSALWLGTGIALKYFPLVYVPLLLLRRRWRVLTATAAVVLALWLGASLCLGWVSVFDFLRQVAAPHLQGNIVGQSNNAVLFQSWNSLLRRVFIYDPLTNPAPLLHIRGGYIWALGLLYCAVAYTFGIGWKALDHLDSVERFHQRFAYISVAAFVILPATATYHALLLAPALVLYLAPYARFNGFDVVTLLSYCAIGVLPYSWTSTFVAKGWLLLVAYPRLWLVSVMFVAMTLAFRKRALLV